MLYLPSSREECQVKVKDTKNAVSFDSHFDGFTQLYQTPMANTVTADIIAITGLGGHAYGSWRGKESLGFMWLRHFLADDLPTCRMMIYGYDAKLRAHNIGKIDNYSRGFLKCIEGIRGTEETRKRPLFFIAHSYGGLIVARSFVKAFRRIEKDNSAQAFLYNGTCGFLFFAVPHKGLVVDDMTRMLGKRGHSRKALLAQIKCDSDMLETIDNDFKDSLYGRKVISFYEELQTPQLQENGNGIWKLTGPPITAVEKDSALLQLLSYLETKIPISADHSTIIKFNATRDRGHQSALTNLHNFERDAKKIVKARFCI
ncbi:MAG: hypothetical protein M1834_006917 [Cirrosporium novae-zelandiae]|nr:MAG: hypothetical protein M1834_006917 [Cirrosporium novae-zelandiae]